MTPELKDKIESAINVKPVCLFMKGDKNFPACGFSARVAQILNHLSTDYNDVNVLDDGEIREGVKEYSEWPTIPQLYVNGEFIGGCDIVSEMFESGELQELLSSSQKAAS